MIWWHSLRKALTAHFLVAALLPVMVFGVVASEYLASQQLAKISMELTGHAESARDEAESFLSEVNVALHMVERTLQQGLLKNPADISRFLELAVRNTPYFESISLLDKQLRVRYLGVSTKLEKQKDDYLGLDLSKHELFRREVLGNEPVWSDTFLSLVTGEPSITLGLPTSQGVLIGTISLQRLADYLNRRVERHGEMSFAIIDRHGTLIAHSNQQLALARENYLFHTEIREALAERHGIPAKFHEDNSLLETVAVIPETGWVVYASQPRQVTLAAYQSIRSTLYAALTIALLMAVGFAMLTARRLTWPLVMMGHITRDVSRGRYDRPLETSGYAELDDLAGSIQQMAEAVREREVSLRESERRHRDLVNSIDGIVWEHDLVADRFTFVSEQALQMLGYPLDEWLGEPDFWSLHLHPDDRDWAVSHRQTLTRMLEDHVSEYRVQAADGRVVWVKDLVTVVARNDEPVTLRGVMIDVTGRKEAELALQESERRFRTIYQTIPDAVVISRFTDGRILDVNDRVVEATGRSREQLLTMTSLELGIWGTAEEREAYLEEIRTRGRVDNFEFTFPDRAGHLLTGLISARVLEIRGEACLLAVVRDISDLKASEERLRRSEARFRSLVAGMGEGLVIIARNGGFLECNRAAERMLGISRAQLLEQGHASAPWQAIHEDGSPYLPHAMPSQRTLETGLPLSGQIMGLAWPDGHTLWLQSSTQPIMPDENGRPEAVLVTFSEVTRLKNIEDELRDSEAKYRHLSQQFQAVLAGITDRIDLLNRDLHVVWSNRSERDPRGADEMSAKGCCYELWQKRDTPCPDCPTLRSFASGEREEGKILDPRGRTWALRSFPILDEQGTISHVIQISEDITEKLIAEQQRIRTGQLAALGELAAGVAHEINNPINGIINYAQLIHNRAAPASRELEIAARIIREGDRIATIVRELLFFARDDGDELHRLQVREALDEALSLSAVQLRKEGVQLHIDLPDELPAIESHKHQVQQLFLNLISNSRYALGEKYAGFDPDKRIDIHGALIRKSGRAYVRLRFRDQGTGIPVELLPRVVNPFVTTKPAGAGTGLGLSISHEIVQKHGGSLSVASEQGAWTEVTVDLPAVEDSDGHVAHAESPGGES